MATFNDDPIVIRKDDDFIHSEIFTFYSKIPKFKFFKLPKNFNESPVRPAIMRVLREGIQSEDSNNKQRHALNAQEIKKELSTYPEPEIKNITYTNLYFHLKKLLEVNVIQIVAYVIEKNHRTAYYGRTARITLFGDTSSELKEYRLKFDELKKFLKVIDPQIDEKIFDQLPERIVEREDKKAKKIAKWMAENEKFIAENRLNVGYIFSALKSLTDSENIDNEVVKKIFTL